MENNTARAKELLKNGANPNEGRFLGFAPAFLSVAAQNVEIVRAMADNGLDIQVRDGSESTLLMWAAYDENARPEMVNLLIKLGADPNATNKRGETALMWALRRGNTPVVAALKAAGASDSRMIREAVEKSIALLQKSGPQFVKVSGCASCHHQSLP